MSDKTPEIPGRELKSTVATSKNSPQDVVGAMLLYTSRWEEGRRGRIQDHSIDQCLARFKNHFTPYFENKRLCDVSVADVRGYENYIRKKGREAKTVSMCMGEAKNFFDYAEHQGWIACSPFDDTYLAPDAKPERRRTPYSMEVLRAACLVHWNNPVFRAMIWLIRFTGARASEIRAIKKTSFEEYYNHPGCEDCVVVHIVESLDRKSKTKSPKNKRSRVTVIPKWVYEFIKPVFKLSETELAFSCTNGKKPVSLDKLLENLRKALFEVTGYSQEYMSKHMWDVHAIRTTFNSYLTGILNDNVRKAVLGWSSEDVGLDHYFELLPTHYQQILDAIKTITNDEEISWCKSHSIFK